MSSTSALSIIKKLHQEIPHSIKRSEELIETISILNNELSFAQFAIAKASLSGELPKDQYFASKNFPMFDPRTLDQAINLSQSIIEPINQILIVPCIIEQQLVGVLFASHARKHWNQSEMILVEIAATEIAKALAATNVGLTTKTPQKAIPKVTKNTVQLIGSSEKLKQVLTMIDRVAPTQASVLILGESGTGKELIAKRIHALSTRADAPFIAINCGAITETLLESELFGHEKGAFTGANTTKKGLVEIASGGTLFLDEIGEMAFSLQAKLLRFLQEGEIFRVGGKEAIHVDVRIVSATNRNLENDVQLGKFREDLYYRLNTISIKSPALRERKEDISQLIEHFTPGTLAHLSTEALQSLKNYSWPGNIRELQNAVERMKIMSQGQMIELKDLPANLKTTHHHLNLQGAQTPVDMPLEDLEKIHILRCLDHNEGNKTRAAQSLGITIKTLYNKLHRYGILDKTETLL